MQLCATDGTQYQVSAPGPTHDRTCATATVCDNARGVFALSPASAAGSDAVCQALSRCSATQFESAAPTLQADRVCSATSVCAAAQYEAAAPSQQGDRVCAAITGCASGQVEARAPDATSNRLCRDKTDAEAATTEAPIRQQLSSSDDRDLNAGAIAGGVVGCLAGAALLGLAWKLKFRKSKKAKMAPEGKRHPGALEIGEGTGTEFEKEMLSAQSSPPARFGQLELALASDEAREATATRPMSFRTKGEMVALAAYLEESV
jgi:hypothetical protein